MQRKTVNARAVPAQGPLVGVSAVAFEGHPAQDGFRLAARAGKRYADCVPRGDPPRSCARVGVGALVALLKLAWGAQGH